MDNNRNTESQLIQQLARYIRQLEEQLAVYEEKDKAQELLIEKLNQALELFAEGLSMSGIEKEVEKLKKHCRTFRHRGKPEKQEYRTG